MLQSRERGAYVRALLERTATAVKDDLMIAWPGLCYRLQLFERHRIARRTLKNRAGDVCGLVEGGESYANHERPQAQSPGERQGQLFGLNDLTGRPGFRPLLGWCIHRITGRKSLPLSDGLARQ